MDVLVLLLSMLAQSGPFETENVTLTVADQGEIFLVCTDVHRDESVSGCQLKNGHSLDEVISIMNQNSCDLNPRPRRNAAPPRRRRR